MYLVATELHAAEIISLDVHLTALYHARWVPAMQRCWENAKGVPMSGHLLKKSSGLRCLLCMLGGHQSYLHAAAGPSLEVCTLQVPASGAVEILLLPRL